MIRKLFKSIHLNEKFDALIQRYDVPRKYLAINRKSVTRGMLIGLFWGFIPMPMQMLAVLAMTPIITFNVPIAFSIVWLSNPMTMPFMYYMEYKTGVALLGREDVIDIELSTAWFQEHWDDIVLPLYIGTIPYSIGVSLVVYLFVNWLWVRSVRRHRNRKR